MQQLQSNAAFAGFVALLWLSTPPAYKGLKQSGIGAVIPASVASNATGTSKPLPSKEALIQGYRACFPDTTPPPAIADDGQKLNDLVFECTTAKQQNKPLSKSARGILNQGYRACFNAAPPKAINKISDQHLAELIDDCAKNQKL